MMQRKVTLEFAYHILEISHENYSTFFSLKVTPGVTPDPDYGLLVFRWIWRGDKRVTRIDLTNFSDVMKCSYSVQQQYMKLLCSYWSLLYSICREALGFTSNVRSRSVGQCTYTSFFIKFPCLFSTSRSMRVNVLPSLFQFFIYLFFLLLFICCFVLKLLSERDRRLQYLFRLVCLASSKSTIQFLGYSRVQRFT